MLSNVQVIILIAVMAVVTYLTRALPFILWKNKDCPSLVVYLGKVLPYAMMGLLVVYCFKSVDFTQTPFGISEIIATLVCAGLYVYKRNNLLSIMGSTLVYMFLVQVVF